MWFKAHILTRKNRRTLSLYQGVRNIVPGKSSPSNRPRLFVPHQFCGISATVVLSHASCKLHSARRVVVLQRTGPLFAWSTHGGKAKTARFRLRKACEHRCITTCKGIREQEKKNRNESTSKRAHAEEQAREKTTKERIGFRTLEPACNIREPAVWLQITRESSHWEILRSTVCKTIRTRAPPEAPENAK